MGTFAQWGMTGAIVLGVATPFAPYNWIAPIWGVLIAVCLLAFLAMKGLDLTEFVWKKVIRR